MWGRENLSTCLPGCFTFNLYGTPSWLFSLFVALSTPHPCLFHPFPSCTVEIPASLRFPARVPGSLIRSPHHSLFSLSTNVLHEKITTLWTNSRVVTRKSTQDARAPTTVIDRMISFKTAPVVMSSPGNTDFSTATPSCSKSWDYCMSQTLGHCSLPHPHGHNLYPCRWTKEDK